GGGGGGCSSVVGGAEVVDDGREVVLLGVGRVVVDGRSVVDSGVDVACDEVRSVGALMANAARCGSSPPVRPSVIHTVKPSNAAAARPSATGTRHACRDRSEEHTAELQSR